MTLPIFIILLIMIPLSAIAYIASIWIISHEYTKREMQQKNDKQRETISQRTANVLKIDKLTRNNHEHRNL